MGGRFDATNVVTPRVGAITPIGMDHTQWLGRTVSAIAQQKAGILKPGVPAVISAQDPPALEVIRAEADARGAPLSFTRDCDTAPLAGPRAGRYADPPAFTLTTPQGGRYPGLTLSLRGTHQVDNAVTAVLIAEHLGIDKTSIAAGLRGAAWPGRLEMIEGTPAILLDGAHNPAGCATLAAYLEEYQPRRDKVLVFAAMKDKDAREMLRVLAPLMRRVVVTGLSVPRGESPAALARLASAVHGKVEESRSIEDALPRAGAAAGGDGIVVVAGSLYLVGETRRFLGQEPVRVSG